MPKYANKQGYTIVEVMIFLAVSGFMFVIAAGFISGKQSHAQFKQGVSDLNSQIQSVMNDVSNGFYPSNGDFTCTVSGGGQPTFTSGSTTQGGNQSCVFMGKVLQFRPNNTGAVDPSAYNVYSVVGRRLNSSGNTPTTFSESQPVAAYNPPGIDLTDKKKIPWGVEVSQVLINGAPTGSVGVFSSFGNYSGGQLSSGSQSIMTFPITGLDLNMTQAAAVAAIGIPNGGAMNPVAPSATDDRHMTICLSDGGSQYATIIIGGKSQRLSTAAQIYNDKSDWTNQGCS